jgi:hypothetical protein
MMMMAINEMVARIVFRCCLPNLQEKWPKMKQNPLKTAKNLPKTFKNGQKPLKTAKM